MGLVAGTLETVTKSVAKKTPLTPFRPKRRLARGETTASCSDLKSAVPLSSRGLPGKNLRLSGFGVPSVWMNRERPASSSGLRRRRCAACEPLPRKRQGRRWRAPTQGGPPSRPTERLCQHSYGCESPLPEGFDDEGSAKRHFPCAPMFPRA